MPLIMPLIAALLVQEPAPDAAAPAEPKPESSLEARYDACLNAATNAPERAKAEATEWRLHGGGFFARQCLGMAYSNLGQWAPAADEFATAAQEAEVAHDPRAAHYWAQAGNARLAGGDPARARAALDAALAAGTLGGLQLGEAQFDRARALVALGDPAAARADIDRALENARADPLIWLASATLARRMGDSARAKADIIEASDRSPGDPSIALEIGNIAASIGDRSGARGAWEEVIRTAPDSAAAQQARASIAQLDSPPAP